MKIAGGNEHKIGDRDLWRCKTRIAEPHLVGSVK